MRQALLSGKMLFALMLFLLFPGITYGGINCHAKLTKVEKLICNNNDLVILDRILNNMYNSISNSSDKYAYIKSDQLRWLNEERNKCKNEDSILKSYNNRIMLLKDYINDLHPNDISNAYIGNNVNVCADLVELYNNNILRVFRVNSEKPKDSDKDIMGERFVKYGNYSVNIGGNVYYLNIGNDQKEMRFIFVFSGGTCSSSEIYNLDILSSTVGKDNGRPESSAMKEQGYDWGSHEILVKYLGQYYVIATSGAYFIIYKIDEDGLIKKHCQYTRDDNIRKLKYYKSEKLCRSIMKHKISALPWKDVTDLLSVSDIPRGRDYLNEFSNRYGTYAGKVSVVKVDIDKDNKVDLIGKFQFDSGAGCGSTQISLRVLRPDLKGQKEGKTNNLLKKYNGSEIDIFKYSKEYFIRVTGYQLDGEVYDISGELWCQFETKLSTK